MYWQEQSAGRQRTLVHEIDPKGSEHEHMTFGLTNRIERWFRTMKGRTKGFYNNINCKDFKSGIDHLQAFLEVFVGLCSLAKGFKSRVTIYHNGI